MKLKGTPCLTECANLLYWAMLAACTVGPGTVVTCSRAGTEYGLSLTWALIFASILAFTLQEGTARLTIVSGKSLGQCLAAKYKHTASLYEVAVICWVVSISVYAGNFFFQMNCWAGGIDAVLAVPGASALSSSSATLLRVGMCGVYAVVVLGLLWFEKTEKLGIFLGVIMISMIVMFLIVVAKMGIDWKKFGLGIIPNIPEKSEVGAEPADLILGLVGTTSLGFNLFLGGEMAKGRDLATSQKGIAFSTITAFTVSELILIVGAGINDVDGKEEYTIEGLSNFISVYAGRVGVTVFAAGFISAALSSMITVALGAGITARSMFIDDEKPNLESSAKEKLEMKKKIMSQSIYFSMCILSAIIISCNVDRLVIILLAQVVNGAILPFLAICLLLCINDDNFMGSAPQKGWNNAALFISVTISLFLASNTILSQKVFEGVLPEVYQRLLLAGVVSGLGMGALCFGTSLGKSLVKSCRRRCYC